MENTSKQDPSEPPPRKRLLTDYLNPKQTSITQSPESTVSFDSSSDRLTKKTRELPNLSDCHSCGVRINYTNPRERLQPLDSMWRIVLLCKTCTKRVSSSDLCPYCFDSVVDEVDCFKCRDCRHSVHKDCVARHDLGLGCFVCVDCWIPDAIAKSVRARKRKKKKSVKLIESTVSVKEGKELGLLVKEAKRKVVLGVVANRKVAALRELKAAARCKKKVVDDAEMAFLLHRAINSSSRISHNSCLGSSVEGDDAPIACYLRRRVSDKINLMNSSSLDVPLLCYSRRHRNGLLRNSESLNSPWMFYTRRHSGSKACSHDTECDRTDKHGSISSAGLNACNLGSNSENSLSGNMLQENDVGMGRIDRNSHRYFLKYHRIGKSKPRPSVEDSDSCSCMNPDNSSAKGMTDTSGFGNGKECTEVSENCDDNTNRFLLKYKRSSRCKSEYSCNVEELSKMLPSNHCGEQTTLSNIRPQSC